MTTYAYERLSAQDSSFLVFEGPTTHMHVGGTSIFEIGPLATPSGGVDIERIRQYIGSRLHFIPRYRQRLAFVPFTNNPVWVDDDRLNLNYHVRHTSLPRPGDETQLKQLTARIISQQLDRGKPLWELWIVEGLEGGRFAMVLKTHHCVVDGVSGVDLMSVLLNPSPTDAVESAPPWMPRRAPTPTELLRDDVVRRAAAPLDLARRLVSALEDPTRARADLAENVSATWEAVSAGLWRPADTPLNRPIGPHRRFDWHGLDLVEVKAVKNCLGGTINDVVLATVAGAVRRFLTQRRVNIDALNYKAVVPVSVRSAAEQGNLGNRVSAWLMSLPIQERDPRRRFTAVQELTTRLKDSKQARGIEMLTQVAELADPILTLGVRLAARMHPYNLIVTNIPGPQFPLYLLGAQMIEGYPHVPLFEYQGLGVALFSYIGKLFWGFNADWELMPDLDRFVRAIGVSFRELHDAATTAAATTELQRAARRAAPAPKSRQASARRVVEPGRG